MLTKDQAEEVVQKIRYRDWKFAPTGATFMDILGDSGGKVRIYVQVTYSAPNSVVPGQSFDNNFVFSFTLPETEAEVARAVFEAITVIEDHERREFFKVDKSVITDRLSDTHLRLPGVLVPD